MSNRVSPVTHAQVEAAAIAFIGDTPEDWRACASTYRASIITQMRAALEAAAALSDS